MLYGDKLQTSNSPGGRVAPAGSARCVVTARGPGANNTLPIVLTILLCVLVGLWGYTDNCTRPPDDTGDESEYLEESARIAEHGGIPGYFRLCFQGRYQRSPANPLLAVSASPFAERSLSFIRPARLFKSILTTLSLLGIFFLTARLAGWERGAWIVAMLALSRNWLGKTGVFTIDPVIYALIFLAWLLIAGVWRPRGRWFWSGAAFGLAYMAKGTALLLLAGLMTAVALRLMFGRDRLQLVRSSRAWKSAGLFVAGWVLVACTLLVQTTLDSTHRSIFFRYLPAGLWLDSWDQYLDPTEQDRMTHGVQSYFRRHSLLDPVKRLVWGMGKQLPRFAGVFACDKNAPKPIWLFTLACSIFLTALGVRGMVREKDRWARLYTVAFVGVGFFLYAWFSPITYASRFAATFGPVFAWYASGELQVLLARISERRASRKPAGEARFRAKPVKVVLAALILALVISNRNKVPRNPFEPLPLEPDFARLMNWYDARIVHENRVCMHTLKLGRRFRFRWLLTPSRSLDMPLLRDFESFVAYADEHDVDFLLLERTAPHKRGPIFGEFVRDDPDEGLVVKAPIPGWELVLSDDDSVTDFLVYEREKNSGA